MSIDEAFDQYPGVIIGFRNNKEYKIIDFWKEAEWDLLTSPDGVLYKELKKNENDGRSYYTIYGVDSTFEGLYKELTRTIEYNLEAEKKQSLFIQRVQDLKKLFTDMSYDDLKSLKIETPLSLEAAKQETLN